jgi:ribosomal protein S18 acetylase RimI-like enzyme
MIIVRESGMQDLPAIFSINKQCHAKPQPEDALQAVMFRGKTWVAEVNGEVVGFLIAYLKGLPYIFNVAVLPQYRGKGFATELFKRFQQFYRQPTSYLEVDSGNPAQKLYFDLGYRVTEVRRNYYGPEQDALVMVKNV